MHCPQDRHSTRRIPAFPPGNPPRPRSSLISKVAKLPRASGEQLPQVRGLISRPRDSEAAEPRGGVEGLSPNEREQKTETKTRQPAPAAPPALRQLWAPPAAEGASFFRHGKLLLLWVLQGGVVLVPSPRSPRRTRSRAERARVRGDRGSAGRDPEGKPSPVCLHLYGWQFRALHRRPAPKGRIAAASSGTQCLVVGDTAVWSTSGLAASVRA